MLIIAHRSGPVSYPEQTILSAQEALSLGADVVEIDVRLTADKKLAITHDQNLKRIFGVEKNIDGITADEFKTLRHQSNAAFCAHMFEDFMKCGVAPLLIHIKRAPGAAESEVVDYLLQEIDRYDYADKVILGIALPETAKQIREHNPVIKILSFSDRGKTAEFIAEKVDYIRLWESWLTPESVAQVKDSGCQLCVMSGNTDGRLVGEPTAENVEKILDYIDENIPVE